MRLQIHVLDDWFKKRVKPDKHDWCVSIRFCTFTDLFVIFVGEVLMNSRAKIGEWPLALVHFAFMRPLEHVFDGEILGTKMSRLELRINGCE